MDAAAPSLPSRSGKLMSGRRHCPPTPCPQPSATHAKLRRLLPHQPYPPDTPQDLTQAPFLRVT